MTGIEALRTAFLHAVDPDGMLAPRWRDVLAGTPRELFAPWFFVPLLDRPGWRLVERSDEWAAGVMANRPLITQIGGSDAALAGARAGEPVTGWATSSSSQPSLMVLMLDALGVAGGAQVLEIGTGTGYNAALLCTTVGARGVTTVDVDGAVVERARTRLAELGHEPVAAVADGHRGFPARAPFDAVIATVAVARVPAAWIDQCREGATILIPLDTRTGGGLLARLTVRGGAAEGPFLPGYGGFMPVREHVRVDAALAALRSVDERHHTARPTELAHDAASGERHPFEYFARLATGGYDVAALVPGDGSPTQTWFATPDGSWVSHTDGDGGGLVREGGPRPFWARVEGLHALWTDLGRPPRERMGLTVRGEHHTVWLDDPQGRFRWDLPFA